MQRNAAAKTSRVELLWPSDDALRNMDTKTPAIVMAGGSATSGYEKLLAAYDAGGGSKRMTLFAVRWTGSGTVADLVANPDEVIAEMRAGKKFPNVMALWSRGTPRLARMICADGLCAEAEGGGGCHVEGMAVKFNQMMKTSARRTRLQLQLLSLKRVKNETRGVVFQDRRLLAMLWLVFDWEAGSHGLMRKIFAVYCSLMRGYQFGSASRPYMMRYNTAAARLMTAVGVVLTDEFHSLTWNGMGHTYLAAMGAIVEEWLELHHPTLKSGLSLTKKPFELDPMLPNELVRVAFDAYIKLKTVKVLKEVTLKKPPGLSGRDADEESFGSDGVKSATKTIVVSKKKKVRELPAETLWLSRRFNAFGVFPAGLKSNKPVNFDAGQDRMVRWFAKRGSDRIRALVTEAMLQCAPIVDIQEPAAPEDEEPNQPDEAVQNESELDDMVEEELIQPSELAQGAGGNLVLEFDLNVADLAAAALETARRFPGDARVAGVDGTRVSASSIAGFNRDLALLEEADEDGIRDSFCKPMKGEEVMQYLAESNDGEEPKYVYWNGFPCHVDFYGGGNEESDAKPEACGKRKRADS